MFMNNTEVIPIALKNFNSNIERPTSLDCLCGKDTTFGRHPGNRMFRKKILASLPGFLAAKNKPEKMKVTKSILDFMKKEGSRFLKLRHNGSWVEIDRQAARDKVSHALRFAARQQKGPQEGDDDDSQTRFSPPPTTTEQVDELTTFDPIPFFRRNSESESLMAPNLPARIEEPGKHTEKVALPNLFRSFYPIPDFSALGPLSKQNARCDSIGVLQFFEDQSSCQSFDVDEIFAREVSDLIAL